MGGGVGGDAAMGSNLSKRKSASQGALHAAAGATPVPADPAAKYKLCSSLPNHLDYPDNNNETKSYEAKLPFPACPLHHTSLIQAYPFITPERVFSVIVTKGSGGLGLSVCGGDPLPGLVRVKRLFPHQPAAMSGRLRPGDVLLAAAGIPLLGLTNYEALEVLRTTPNEVKLTVCRPPEPMAPTLDTPPPPPPPPPRDCKPNGIVGEFEIVMEKVNGSLGFTLRKEDHSALGHYVRALVREPALSDTRIRPGDKIVAVNDMEMSNLSHEEAVAFLRQCGNQVRLRLYRDPVQTPLPAHSPTHRNPPQFKPILRKEAQDMLNEIASRKSQSPQDSSSSGSNKGSSPRKRRLTRTPPPQPDSIDYISGDEDCSRRLPTRPLQLKIAPNPTDFHFTNLAKQPSDEELIASGLGGSGTPPDEPVSMPPTVDQATPNFSHKHPAYRSANPTVPSKHQESEDGNSGAGGHSEHDIPGAVDGGPKGLLKWKGVVFTPDEADPDDLTSLPPPTEPPPVPGPSSAPDDTGLDYKVVIVELNRGWNSRLGFSLQNRDGGTVISAIYNDSVASRDGRLRVGDRLINVNDEKIEDMPTSEVIDLLRKIRGSICLTLLRKPKD